MKRQNSHVEWWMVGVLVMLFQLAAPCLDGWCAVTGTAENGAVQKALNARIPFVANNGQVDVQAAYVAQMFGGTLFVTRQGELVYKLPKPRATHSAVAKNEGGKSVSDADEIAEFNDNEAIDGIVLREVLIDDDNHRLIPDTIQGKNGTPTRINYFKGNDPSQWKTDLSTYAVIYFGEVYERIDFKLHAYGNNVEKLFTVHPGGEVENIKLGVDGADSLRVNSRGALEVATSMGVVTFTKPVAYQIIHGKRVEVEAAYKVDPEPVPTAVYSFEIASYDTSEDLIIDPLLASTFLGGGNLDMGVEIALDSSGNIIVSGMTDSESFPTTTGAYAESIGGGQDIFVAKLNSAGDQLLFATYIGGSGNEFYNDPFELYRFGMAVDGSGDIYVANNTASTNFPVTLGAYDTDFNGGESDLFVAKLSSTGNQLLYSTFLGGSDAEYGGGIDVDSAGDAYVTGTTHSTNFPTTSGAYDETFNGGDSNIFVTKINPSGSGLIYSTFLGGSNWNESTDLAVDSSGCAYILGGGG
ncbi:MAG: SBBP repeat-containing protein, partial [Nitrospirota bacterium]